MTCRNHPVRAKEFGMFCSAASVSGQILDNEIRRSVQFGFVRRVYRALGRADRERPFLALFAHSCFGDDHFHPQHVAVFFGALLYAVTHGKALIVHDSYSELTWRQFVGLAYTRSAGSRISRLLKCSIKTTLFGLQRTAFRWKLIADAPEGICQIASESYRTQDLGYASFKQRRWHYRCSRNLAL